MNERTRVAVVGLGIGLAHVAGYLSCQHARLVAVADAWEPRRRTIGGTFAQGSMHVLRPLFAKQPLTDRILADRWEDHGIRVVRSISDIVDDTGIELVSVCTPDDLHADHAVALLNSGKDVLLEKPVALSVEGAERVRDAAKGSAHRVAIGYEFRINPAISQLRDLVRRGALGPIHAFSLHHYRTPFRRDKWHSWIQSADRSGGLLVEETCHWFDLARFVSGKEIATVHAVGTDRVHRDFDYEDVVYVQGRYIDGAAYQIAHALTGFDFSLTVQVHGENGSAWCALKEDQVSSLDGRTSRHLGVLAHAFHGASPSDAVVTTFGWEVTEPENIRDLAADTVEAVREGRPFAAEWFDGYESLRIALAARRSLHTGNEVQL